MTTVEVKAADPGSVEQTNAHGLLSKLIIDHLQLDSYQGALSWAVLLAFSYLLYRNTLKGANKLPLPPGPRALPIIGNLHQNPSAEQWKTYESWHKKYGPLIRLKLAGFDVILVAKDLLDKKGRIYSSRPRMIYLSECMTRGLQPGFMPYGDLWKTLHRLETPFLNPTAMKAYHDVHDLQSAQLVHDLLNTKDPAEDLKRYTCSVAFTLALGRTLSVDGDKDLYTLASYIEKKMTHFHWANFLVDVFPVLNYLPDSFASWRRDGTKMYDEEIRLMTGAMESAKETGNWCWSNALMKQNEEEKLSHEQMCYFVGELILGAYISTTSMLNLFVSMCTIWPSCMHKIQAELDANVGPDRLPAVSDESNLPYLNAFVMEVLRWRPLAPLGMLHSVSEDDEYEGYRIPKGSVVITNHYCVDRDPEVHDAPEEFRPERWLENPDLPLSAFGFGRRKCPGSKFAHRSLYMALSRFLWAFDLTPMDSMNAEEELRRMQQKGHAIPAVPPPARANFTVRSPKHREVVENEWQSVEKDEKKILSEIGTKVVLTGK
ncbi:unnamed protein product [Penicillium bialowiezense]